MLKSLISPSGTVFKVVVGIVVTGAFLNMAGNGKLGVQAQKMAKYITNGYGV